MKMSDSQQMPCTNEEQLQSRSPETPVIETCPYNVDHKVKKDEIVRHINICPNRPTTPKIIDIIEIPDSSNGEETDITSVVKEVEDSIQQKEEEPDVKKDVAKEEGEGGVEEAETKDEHETTKEDEDDEDKETMREEEDPPEDEEEEGEDGAGQEYEYQEQTEEEIALRNQANLAYEMEPDWD